MKKTLLTIIFLSLPLLTSAQVTLGNGLVGYWPLDTRDFFSTLSTSVADRSGNNLTGTLVNTPTRVAGKLGQALKFTSASSQQVTVAANAAMNLTAVTASAWIKATSFPNAYNGILQRGNSTAYYEYFVKSNGKIAMYLLPTVQVSYDGTGATTLVANTWYHVVMTYDSTQGLKGYVNAVLDGSAAANGNIGSTNGLTLAIGNDFFTAGRFFNGVIDDVHLYNRALTANEVNQLYREGRGSHEDTFIGTILQAIGGLF